MDIQEKSRREYRARINRVMDYIDANIDEGIDLSKLAEVAHFSPFHFHRIFSALVGETPNGFLQRIRIEKAASILQKNTDMPISEVAFRCGFGDPSSFSRSFKKHFGISAGQYRKEEEALFTTDGIHYYSKDGQPLRKISQRLLDSDHDLCGVELKKHIIMDTKVEIRELPEMNVVYIRHTGEFNQISKAYEKIFRWAGPRGLIGPGSRTVTVYHDDPSVTAIENLRQSACLIVEGDVKADGEVGRMTIPGGKYAVGRFEIHVTQFAEAWNTMCVWLAGSGWQPGEQNSLEIYYADPHNHPEGKFVLDICLSVKPL